VAPAPAAVRFTDRRHGDLAAGSPGAPGRRRAVVDLPWTWLRQVHGREVVLVGAPGAAAGATGDAAVTAAPGAVVSVQVADCAPLALIGSRAVGAVHAGWRGLAAGVVPAAVAAVQELSPGPVRAVLGPCIRPGCYEFGAADLDEVAGALGDHVRGRTAGGAPALDLPAAVRSSLEAAGVVDLEDAGVCTGCSRQHWSHRRGGHRQRQALAVWLEP
jgi:polyphenol oxidase